MPSEKHTIACFGATGGCVGEALACALRDGHHCNALARTPNKLRDFLVTKHNISSTTIKQYLTIYEGDVKDPAAVAKVLVRPNHNGHLVDVILSGVGAYPIFQWGISPLGMTDPTICETAIGAIYTAISNISSASEQPIATTITGEKPLLVVVSTAGCGRRRGIPLPIYLPYHYIFRSPLADKRRMEELLFASRGTHVRDFVVMRPLFLTDEDARGDTGLRVGWEWGVEGSDNRDEEPGPVLGYSVSRKDVGKWMFEKVILQGGWDGKCVYLTY